jgi:hypothetical protein
MNDTREDAGSSLSRLDPIAPGRFADLASTTEANQLLEQILSGHDTRSDGVVRLPHRRTARRWVAAASVAAALLAAVVILQFPRAEVASAVEFQQNGDYIEAVIVDPQATKAELEQAFAEHGFSIDVRLLPTAPSLAGKVLMMMEDPGAQQHPIRTIYQAGECWTDGGGFRCPVGVRIPLDFEGHAMIGIGRLAADGELYQHANPNPFSPGGPLFCSDLPGKTVAEALPVLKELGITAVWRSAARSIDDVDGIDPGLIGDEFVGVDGSSISNDRAYVWVSSTNDFPDGQDCSTYYG